MGGVFAALLDTCVLWPSLQRDFLLSMAIEGLYRPPWSEAILQELHRHERYKLIDRGGEEADALAQADRLLDNMRVHFDDALVTGWEPLEGTFGLTESATNTCSRPPSSAAPARSSPTTTNTFPPVWSPTTSRSSPAESSPPTPMSTERAARALRVMSDRRTKTKHTPHQLVQLLVARYGMQDVADIVLPVLDEAAARND